MEDGFFIWNDVVPLEGDIDNIGNRNWERKYVAIEPKW